MRTALLGGFAIGYYFGAKAGRERYLQLHKVVTKVEALGRLGVERLRHSNGAQVVALKPAASA